MGHRVLGRTEEVMKNYRPIKGLEGPFIFPNHRIVYYDTREGKYWDPKTDWYLTSDEVHELQNDLIRALR